MRSGSACVAILFAVAVAVYRPRPANQKPILLHRLPGSHKYPRPKPSLSHDEMTSRPVHGPRPIHGRPHTRPGLKKPKRHHSKADAIMPPQPTKPHSGFALTGELYHKGKFVKCPKKQTLVCKDNQCNIPVCEDVKMNEIIPNLCLSGPEVYKCKSPLVCDCDYLNGFVRSSSETNGTCVREKACFNPGVVQSLWRCDYEGCKDNLKCAEAWTEPNRCNASHKLAECGEKKQKRCPLNYYWNNTECVPREHCIKCPDFEMPVCASDSDHCKEPTCESVWKKREQKETCDRVEEFPDCSTQPVCVCSSDDYVRYTDENGGHGFCDFDADCVTCGPKEYPYCPDLKKNCKERTVEDIDNDRESVPCEPLGNDQCTVKPECHCLYPYIRDNDTNCVMPSHIFTECNDDDFTKVVCKSGSCSLRTCEDQTPKSPCNGTVDDLYNCIRSKIACQCSKGSYMFNADDITPGSRSTCASQHTCLAMGLRNEKSSSSSEKK